jgi:hypothetical protein
MNNDECSSSSATFRRAGPIPAAPPPPITGQNPKITQKILFFQPKIPF